MDSCSTCDRYFVNPQALKQHALSKHPETYCFRCERNFRHVQAKEQHIKASRNHWVCAFCPELDFHTQKALKVHYKEEHNSCTKCDTVFRYSYDLYEHELEEHNKCMQCGRTFSSESNLKNHLKTHKSKDIDCPGCEKMFISNSAMVLHLETGYCPSGADEDTLRDVAQDCDSWRSYVSYDSDCDFQCPTCDKPARLMSALLQHAESVYGCDQELRHFGSLREFLRVLELRVGGLRYYS